MSESDRLPPAPKVEGFRLRTLVAWSEAVPTSTSRLTMTALIILLVVFGVGGTWASTAKIGGALVTSGRVFAEGNNRVIQHLEGGIISEIAVKEGDHVEAGQTLVHLDETANRSQLDRVLVDKAIYSIELARWRAERQETSTQFSVEKDSLSPVAEHPRVVEALESQINELQSSRQARQQQMLVLDGKVNNEKEDLVYLKELLEAYDSQKGLLEKEEASYADLLSKGLVRQSQVFALQRQLAQLDAQRSNALAAIQKSNHNIQSFHDEKQRIFSEHTELVSRKITETQQKLNQSEDFVTRLNDLLNRARVTTPVSGTVLSMPFKSIGAVVQPGEKIAEILPNATRLMLEAFISPEDITKVFIDQDAEVVFPSDDVRVLPPLKGKVSYISADTLTHKENGMSYYIIHVHMDDNHHGRNILPGNVADVFFKTDSKTLFEYISEPLTRFAQKTYTE